MRKYDHDASYVLGNEKWEKKRTHPMAL